MVIRKGMIKNKFSTILIMLASGFVSPLVFFYSQYAGGDSVQANVISIKATITFLSGLMILGYDKSYSFHYARGEKEGLETGFLLVLFNISLAFIILLGISFIKSDYRWLAVAIGVLGDIFFYISRAYAISINNLKLVNKFTLLFYFFNVCFLFLVSSSVISYFIFFNTVWLIVAIYFLFKSKFFTIFSFNYRITDIFNIKKFKYFKFGLGDFSAGLSSAAPAFFIYQAFDLNGMNHQNAIIAIGFIFLIKSLLIYPISALLPLLVVSKIEKTSFFKNSKLVSLFGFFAFILITLGLSVFFKLIFYLFDLEPYYLVYEQILLSALYLGLSFAIYTIQYLFLLKKEYKFTITMIYTKIILYFLGIIFISFFLKIDFLSVLILMVFVEFISFIWLFLRGFFE